MKKEEEDKKEGEETKEKREKAPIWSFYSKVQAWVVTNFKEVGQEALTQVHIKKAKRKGSFLKTKGQTFPITTSPILVVYKKLGFTCIKPVFLCDEETGATMKIKTEAPERGPGSIWALTPYLLDSVVNAGLFSIMFKSFKTSLGLILMTFLIGILFGFVLGQLLALF